MDVSVVVPLFNEDESLPELTRWIDKVAKDNNLVYEIILINDGSTDNSWTVIKQLCSENKNIKAVKFRRNHGKAAALQCGFQQAQGKVVITMDADLQDSPDEIPELCKMILEQDWDMISGWKKRRNDPIGKTIPSKVFNGLAKMMTGIELHDFNCGLKAYRKDVVKNIELFGEMHRYIPALAKAAGFPKIGEKVVHHRERKYGKSKYGLGRMKGMLDLITIVFVSKFGRKPMHLFGSLGVFCFLVGFIILTYLTYCKIFMSVYNMTQRPIFFLGIICLLVGTQLFLTGFLAELTTRASSDKKYYNIDETINTN
ncbi:MAG: glycosyltransferase [Bacteroidales bacterium]|nr:glycosyltransferase [Bacteroidales bacterium]